MPPGRLGEEVEWGLFDRRQEPPDADGMAVRSALWSLSPPLLAGHRTFSNMPGASEAAAIIICQRPFDASSKSFLRFYVGLAKDNYFLSRN